MALRGLGRQVFGRRGLISASASALATAAGAGSRNVSTYVLPPLKYKYDALEPHIDGKTMQIHHTRHHQTYVSSLNGIITGSDGSSVAGRPLHEVVASVGTLPDSIRTPTINHAGGHLNHALFFSHLRGAEDEGAREASGDLRAAIEESFGSYDEFKSQLSTAAVKVFGSGWAWLQLSAEGRLEISQTKNQENPLMKGVVANPGTPIMGIDVWEHAYYLKNQNRRPEYVESFWNVIDWDVVGENFAKASDGNSSFVHVPTEEHE